MPEKTLPAVRPARMPQIDRARELLWLAENQRSYAGQWVALEGDKLLGAGFRPALVARSGARRRQPQTARHSRAD